MKMKRYQYVLFLLLVGLGATSPRLASKSWTDDGQSGTITAEAAGSSPVCLGGRSVLYYLPSSLVEISVQDRRPAESNVF